MENIIDYVENNLKTFDLQAFSAVDSLILSELSYTRFDLVVPTLQQRKRPVKFRELLKAELFHSMFQNIRDVEKHRRFISALAASPRFRDIELNYYVNNIDALLEKQFSACTFFIGDKTAYIAYRGTDSTFVGWKEDFNMAYISPVPAQVDGVNYLNSVAKRIPKSIRLRVGGHSKGGNIAVYSAVKCHSAVQNRIVTTFNHDGPGFKENLFASNEFLKAKDRIFTTIPESAMIGMLLQHHEDYRVIKSSQHGIMQHDPFSWNVENDDFCYAQKVSSSASVRSKTLSEWLNSISDDKRKMFIDELFQILDQTETESFRELSSEWPKKAPKLLSSIKNSDPEIKKFLQSTLYEFVKLSVSNLFTFNERASE